MFDEQSFDVQAYSTDAWLFGVVAPPASLGAWGDYRRSRRGKDEDEDEALIPEALDAATVSRLRDEMLGGMLSQEARQLRRKRAEEEALILMM